MDWKSVLRTGYFTSVVSYLLFLLLEWLRPGFVSKVFSPHLFLASAVVFGILWGWIGWGQAANREFFYHPKYQTKGYIGCLLLGLIFGWVVWAEGRAFEEYRVLVTIVAFLTPSTIYHLLFTS